MTRRAAAAAMGGILAVALALRLWAFAGISGVYLADDTRYATVAQNLANGHAPRGDAEWFGARVAFLWPVAGAFRAFGAGDRAAAAWPLAASLASVVAAYLVAWELTGKRRVAVLAAAILAATPLEVLAATRLRPDAVMPAFIGFAVWAALRSGRPSARRLAWAALAGALVAAAWSAREMAVVMVPVVIAAGGRPDVRRLAAGAAGAGAVVAGACAALAAAGGAWSMPLTGTAGASQARAPWSAWSWRDSYAAWALEHVATPGHPAFAAAIVVGLSAAVLGRRAPRRALVPAAWAAWGYVYLEFVALINLTPSPRFLTLVTLPLAVLVAMAADLVPVTGPVGAVAAAVVASAMAAAPIASRLDRAHNVDRVADVTAWLSDRGATAALSDDYVTFTKVNLFLARERLPVPRAVDPGFGGGSRRAAQAPLPDVTAFRGGYVVEVPVRPQGGPPGNWRAFRAAVRAERDAGAWVPRARVDDARILAWPR